MSLEEKYHIARERVLENGLRAFMKSLDGIPFDAFLYIAPEDKTSGRTSWCKAELTFDFKNNIIHIKDFHDLKAYSLFEAIDETPESVLEKEVHLTLSSPEGNLSYGETRLIEIGVYFKLRQLFKTIGC